MPKDEIKKNAASDYHKAPMESGTKHKLEKMEAYHCQHMAKYAYMSDKLASYCRNAKNQTVTS